MALTESEAATASVLVSPRASVAADVTPGANTFPAWRLKDGPVETPAVRGWLAIDFVATAVSVAATDLALATARARDGRAASATLRTAPVDRPIVGTEVRLAVRTAPACLVTWGEVLVAADRAAPALFTSEGPIVAPTDRRAPTWRASTGEAVTLGVRVLVKGCAPPARISTTTMLCFTLGAVSLIVTTVPELVVLAFCICTQNASASVELVSTPELPLIVEVWAVPTVGPVALV